MPVFLDNDLGEDMRTIKELDDLVKYRIKKTEENYAYHNGLHRMDFLFPDKSVLEGFNTSQLLIIVRKYGMLLPSCSLCQSIQPNGKWVPREGPIDVLLKNYKRLSHGYCNDCLEKQGVPPDETIK